MEAEEEVERERSGRGVLQSIQCLFSLVFFHLLLCISIHLSIYLSTHRQSG